MNHFISILTLLGSGALALDHHYHQQRKIKCTIKSQQDIQALHSLRQSSSIDLWDEGIDHLPVDITMRVHLEILPVVQASFACTPPQKIFLPIEKHSLVRKTVKPEDFFKDYRSYEQIVAFVNGLAARNPQRVLKIESMGKSGEGRDMPVVILGKNNLIPKHSLWVNGGQHAREWIAPASCLYLMDKVFYILKFCFIDCSCE